MLHLFHFFADGEKNKQSADDPHDEHLPVFGQVDIGQITEQRLKNAHDSRSPVLVFSVETKSTIKIIIQHFPRKSKGKSQDFEKFPLIYPRVERQSFIDKVQKVRYNTR